MWQVPCWVWQSLIWSVPGYQHRQHWHTCLSSTWTLPYLVTCAVTPGSWLRSDRSVTSRWSEPGPSSSGVQWLRLRETEYHRYHLVNVVITHTWWYNTSCFRLAAIMGVCVQNCNVRFKLNKWKIIILTDHNFLQNWYCGLLIRVKQFQQQQQWYHPRRFWFIASKCCTDVMILSTGSLAAQNFIVLLNQELPHMKDHINIFWNQ